MMQFPKFMDDKLTVTDRTATVSVAVTGPFDVGLVATAGEESATSAATDASATTTERLGTRGLSAPPLACGLRTNEIRSGNRRIRRECRSSILPPLPRTDNHPGVNHNALSEYSADFSRDGGARLTGCERRLAVGSRRARRQGGAGRAPAADHARAG